MNKVLYKPVGLILGALSGVLASTVFKHVWKRFSGEDEAPSATDRDYGWREVLVAAGVQGAIFGTVKAAVDRAGAEGYKKATGKWPGD